MTESNTILKIWKYALFFEFFSPKDTIRDGEEDGDYIIYPADDRNGVRRDVYRNDKIDKCDECTYYYIKFIFSGLLHFILAHGEHFLDRRYSFRGYLFRYPHFG